MTAMTTLHLAQDPDADALLSQDPLALLLGMLLDQQIPMEKAFTSPHVLAERLGFDRLDAHAIAAMDPGALVAVFRQPPALHRFPAAMAQRAQSLCAALVQTYDGEATAVWSPAGTGADLVARVGSLPGFGDQKARIFAALLGKQLGVRPPGWREACGAYGDSGSFRSVADVIDRASLLQVRAFKKEQKAAARAPRT